PPARARAPAPAAQPPPRAASPGPACPAARPVRSPRSAPPGSSRTTPSCRFLLKPPALPCGRLAPGGRREPTRDAGAALAPECSPPPASGRRGAPRRAPALLVVDLQHGEEGLLRDLHPPDLLHPLLAFLLLLEQLLLARRVAAVALGEHVLAQGLDRGPGDDLRADRSLDGDVEHLPGDQFLHPLGEVAAPAVGMG